MKNLLAGLLAFALILLVLPAMAQENSAVSDDRVYVSVEKSAEFPGGMQEIGRYLAENIQYPAQAREEGREGLVVLNFVVDQKGEIEQIKILKSQGEALDNEAIRVISQMPAWKPGRQNGKDVKTLWTLPIRFSL